MPPRTTNNKSVQLDQLRHVEAARTNLPTADAEEFVRPDIAERRRILIQRDSSLDPQLVWKNKYGTESDAAIENSESLEADAPPLYIQEKIDPRVLIEDLRRTSSERKTSEEFQPRLFESFEEFDGLDELDSIDFYRHDANWSNRMILGDSLQVMSSLAEREELRGRVQMIYIDPPYGIKFGSNWQVSARKRDVKDGKDEAREAEQIKAFRDTWELGIHSYLSYLRDRLYAARELLTESGSCFVQIGDENVHLVRSLMDEVFGSENLISQIVFEKTTSSSMDYLDGVSDYIIWYSKNHDKVKYRQLFVDKKKKAGRFIELPDGTRRPATSAERRGAESVPQGSRWYEVGDLTSQTDSSKARYTVEFDGEEFPPGKRNWATPARGMEKAIRARRVERRASSIGLVRFADDFPVVPLRNNWTDTGTGSFTDDKVYVVQTTTKAVQRCLLMSTDPGDLVLDPTGGSGTTAVVAEQWGRRWITIDTSRVALALTRQRLMGSKFPMYLLADSAEGRRSESAATGGRTVLDASPTRNDVRKGFVYKRVPHITLKSIASTPNIEEGMSRTEVDAAIKQHADVELLYDQPYEDRETVRVCGPFTVESLSPHRSIAFSGLGASEYATASEQIGARQPDAPDFERSILDNLKQAGIQNGTKDERIEFSAIEPYGGEFIQAKGESRAGLQIGIVIGPQYGTVDKKVIRGAVNEAVASHRKSSTPNFDMLAVLGFSFDANTGELTEEDNVTARTEPVVPETTGSSVTEERVYGKVTLLQVRMNTDLLMGTALKKTGRGNLFTVFGEPDIDIHKTTDDGISVSLNGVDIYDPTSGRVRSSDTSQIALWMVDTNYNGESFFVRHCYFTGGHDPFKRLKTALKSDIDMDAWATLYSTKSREFVRPDTGRIAVKVINDYGDEVMKVFDV